MLSKKAELEGERVKLDWEQTRVPICRAWFLPLLATAEKVRMAGLAGSSETYSRGTSLHSGLVGRIE